MDKLLGHLAQFGSLTTQGELLCTQGLTYLLRNAEAERVFAKWVSKVTCHTVSPGLTWLAESRQEDGGRPDLEGRDADGAVIKIEAKLGAPFGAGQLDSYVKDLCKREEGGTLLILVPGARVNEITGSTREHLKVDGAAPWRIPRDAIQILCTVATWEDLLKELAAVDSDGFRDDLAQFHAMYRVFNGDDMAPLTSDEQVLAWRDNETWWEVLVEKASRELTPGEAVLPFRRGKEAQPYHMRYVPGRVSESYYSIGIRDPFEHHETPIWLRFHKATGQFTNISRRLVRSAYRNVMNRSEGHAWLPLEVPLNSDRNTMVGSLVEQTRRILDVAYGPDGE